MKAIHTFDNTEDGVRGVVVAGKRDPKFPFHVLLIDLDTDRPLPMVYMFATEDGAIAKAKHLAGVA